MADLDIGFEILENTVGDGGADAIEGIADVTGDAQAQAVGVENAELGEAAEGFTIDLNGGDDTIDGTASATANQQASADGIRTIGSTQLDDGADRIQGIGEATTAVDGEITLATGVNNTNGGSVDLGDGNNTVSGEGNATGVGNSQVESYGILTTDTVAGAGDDQFDGTTVADGGNLGTASGIRVGTFEDNTIAVEGGEPLPNEAGTLDAGDGANTLNGTGTATTTSSGDNVLFNDVNGILVDVDSELTTGSDADTITGSGTTIDDGVGGGNFLTLNALSADGVEARGDIATGGGNDVIDGVGVGEATNSFAVVEGVDIGFGNNLNNALGGNDNLVDVAPTVDLGSGNDRIVGSGKSTVDGDEAATITAGIQNVGTVRAGSGKDTLQGSAESVVVGGANGIRGAIADGIQNFVINDALGVDQDGTIDLGAGNDVVKADASAVIDDLSAFATGFAGGTLRAGTGNDTIDGSANASGGDEVGSTGVFFVDANTDAGNDQIIGNANAVGAASTDARGISVGLSDIDDDSLQNPDDSSAVQAAQVGRLETGTGKDTLRGSADVTVSAQDGDEIFFAGANGIVNDGGTLEQLENLLGAETFALLSQIQRGEVEDPAVIEQVEAAVREILPEIETSTLDTGSGDDELIANVTLNVEQDGQGADDDLEVIGDGLENAGDVLLGSGNDSVNSTVSVDTKIAGAKGLADALDNSSVGIITGLNQEINTETVFDLGAGNDTFTSNIEATAVDDLSAADGLGNRGTFIAGAGNDTFDLNAQSSFVLQEEKFEEQQEGIADGWENRANVFLNEGDDSVTTNADASGEGVLTIAEGLESRELFDAGGGNDRFDLTANATTGEGSLVDNLTQASGLQTEQIDEGEFFLGFGSDTVVGRATATSEAVAGTNSRGEDFTPSTFAFGITQMTADANNVNPDAGTGLLDAGTGNDVLDGVATASGQTEVASFGLLLENTLTDTGNDTLKGKATADSGDTTQATGIAVGLAEDVFLKTNSRGQNYGLGAEAGALKTGDGDDKLRATAQASAALRAVARGIDGANGDINLGSGNDAITAEATANTTSEGGTRDAVGIFGGNIKTGNGADTIEARSNKRLVGSSDVVLDGGQGLGGNVNIDLESGNDTLFGFGEANADGGSGQDTLQFEFSLSEFVTGGGTVDFAETLAFTFDETTLQANNFERFEFNVGSSIGSGSSDNATTFSTNSFEDDSTAVESFDSVNALEQAIQAIEVA
ncbi:MAG: hypothetical protein AAFN08_10975 [Cyanobacteria bacterium J06559_3]